MKYPFYIIKAMNNINIDIYLFDLPSFINIKMISIKYFILFLPYLF